MCLVVVNGVDVIFFGVEKFNVWVCVNNFCMEELLEIMVFLYSYGVKGFLIFNILIFENELVDVKELIDVCVDVGVDVVIVQDLGLVKLICEILLDFLIYGFIQMMIILLEVVEFMKLFDMECVVFGWENNLK